jgi:pimeloyl-ACP methyl ester carboxylesterase
VPRKTSVSSDLLYFTERGSGPPLLLVHGAMITGEMFQPVLDAFAARHRVLVPDLRGHGRSRALGPPYTVAQLAADLAQLLEHLGISSASVLGYSQGGAVAQQLALDYPSRCNRLVLACTYAYNMATFREQVEGRIVPLVLRIIGPRRFVNLVLKYGMKQVDKDRAAWLASLIADQDRKLMVIEWKELLAFDSRRRLGEIKCPTLIIAGSKDEAVPMHHAEMLHDGIAGSRLVVIEGADHTLIWARPDEFVRVTEEFLAASGK